MIFPLPSSPHCMPIKIVFAIEIRTGQKIFPMYPAGHSRDCLQMISCRDPRARNFGVCAFRTLSVGEADSFPANFSDGYGAGDCSPRASAFPAGETFGCSRPDSIMVGRIGPTPSGFSGRDLDVRDVLFCSTGVCLFTGLGVSATLGVDGAAISTSDSPGLTDCGRRLFSCPSAARAPAVRICSSVGSAEEDFF